MLPGMEPKQYGCARTNSWQNEDEVVKQTAEGVSLYLSAKRVRIFPLILIFCLCFATVTSPSAFDPSSVKVGGAYLGTLNVILGDNEGATNPRRFQFDFAANVDIEWQLSSIVTGTVQLQGGAGDGSLGFVGPAVEVTDLNLIFTFEDPDLCITAGSFDTPFGEQTWYLTDNADASRNPFLLNSLFYTAFAGGPVGTLNTLGIMGSISRSAFDLTLAVTNGTNETASNPDGNFETVACLGVTPLGFSGMRLAGSLIHSKDKAESGVSGTESDFFGWMVEGRYAFMEGFYLKAYYGRIEYGDNAPGTDDDVQICMGEARFGQGKWFLAARASGWHPGDDNGDGVGVSLSVPDPGLAVWSTAEPITDQRIRRIQLGAGLILQENLTLKGEWFRDDYDKGQHRLSVDVTGVIVALNGTF